MTMRYLTTVASLAVAYFVLGLIVLIPDHGEHGVTPVWLPSGVAIYFLLQYGVRVWPGIVAGIMLLALAKGMPASVALLAATGSTLEAVVPALILRHSSVFRTDLRRIADVIRFVGFVGLLGPVFSAVLGTYAMLDAGGDLVRTNALNVGVMWWWGNSLGGIVFGAFLLVWHREFTVRSSPPYLLILTVSLLGGLTGFLATWVFSGTLSLLMINFLIPVVVYAAIKTGHLGVTATSLLTSLVVLFSPDTPGSTSLVLDGGIDIDVVSLMVVWTDCLIGLAVAAAYDEYYASRSFEHQAMHDHMTGLYNRTGFMDRLERALTETRRDNTRHVLLHFDVDGMKVVNDRFGHHVGDLLLTGFAQELRSLIGKKDSLGRIGGDDFAILLQDCDEIPGKSSAEAICRDIENKVFDCEIERLSMTVSVGLVVVDAHGSTPEQLLMEVDTACYQAKKAGGNQVVAYGEVSRPVYV